MSDDILKELDISSEAVEDTIIIEKQSATKKAAKSRKKAVEKAKEVAEEKKVDSFENTIIKWKIIKGLNKLTNETIYEYGEYRIGDLLNQLDKMLTPLGARMTVDKNDMTITIRSGLGYEDCLNFNQPEKKILNAIKKIPTGSGLVGHVDMGY